jgi:hypothetical protein
MFSRLLSSFDLLLSLLVFLDWGLTSLLTCFRQMGVLLNTASVKVLDAWGGLVTAAHDITEQVFFLSSFMIVTEGDAVWLLLSFILSFAFSTHAFMHSLLCVMSDFLGCFLLLSLLVLLISVALPYSLAFVRWMCFSTL